MSTLVDIILDDGTELTCSMATIKYIDLGEHKAVQMKWHDTGVVIWKD